MAFRGWSAEAVDFFEGLQADNSKTYWQRNKHVYESCVRAPMEELLDELEPEFGAGRIFRPYRDLRFSRDKSPYKTQIAAAVGDGYVQLSAEGLGVGSGMWEMAADQLDRYRRAVDAERSGGRLSDIVAEVGSSGPTVMGHEVLKTAPRGYPKDHPRIELLRCKGLVAWRQWPVGPWLGTRRPVSRVAEFLRLTRPLSEWLREHVGPSTQTHMR